jgi:hypothetical protein
MGFVKFLACLRRAPKRALLRVIDLQTRSTLPSAALGLLALGACHDAHAPLENGQSSHANGQNAGPEAGVAEAGVVAVHEAGNDAGDAGPFVSAPTTEDGRPGLCARVGDDAVRDIFCADADSGVTGLRDLAGRLQINTLRASVDEATAQAITLDPSGFVSTAVFLGHSTALAGQIVSPINPRAILVGYQSLIAFQRGVQQVEIASQDRALAKLNFYLLSFEQTCNAKTSGCTPGDLYTLSIERGWTALSLHDDEDLKNTPSDCRQCHQRGREQASLLMRELRGPWTHFFGLDPGDQAYAPGSEVDGRDLVRDYQLAKGDESYAGLPASYLGHTAGFTLQNRVDSAQPLDFNTPVIEQELLGADADAGMRRSATWDSAYAAFKRGEQLALPYFETRATDPTKQAALSDAYARYRTGAISADQLPDLADIFPDDPQVRAEIGLQTEPNASAAETLIQACGSCHNDVLDQTISRARFNIALSRMSRDELDLAIARIETSESLAGAMPPPGVRKLDAEGKQRLLTFLKQSARSAQDDALLEHAATVGMAQERADYPRL